MRLLDLFCGHWGWSRAFAARGWECVGVDLCDLNEVDKPLGATFRCLDVLDLGVCNGKVCTLLADEWDVDFICASPPCEQFSVHGMRNFHPNPPYPALGIALFNHTRHLCASSGVPYVMENVRAAQQFVGRAVHHAGPFYLWGNAVPPLLHRGIVKGQRFRGAPGAYMENRPADVTVKEWRNRYQQKAEKLAGGRANCGNFAATIPPELANCVAEYAERLLEQKKVAVGGEGDSVAP